MSKNLKKLLVAALVLTMTMCLLAGCGCAPRGLKTASQGIYFK